MRFPSCMQHTQRNGRNATDARLATLSKSEIHNACTRKKQSTHIFYSLRAFHFLALRPLRCVQQLGNWPFKSVFWPFKSVFWDLCALVTALPCYGALEIVVFDWLIDWFCILTVAALFRRSARIRQHAIGKFLFDDGGWFWDPTSNNRSHSNAVVFPFPSLFKSSSHSSGNLIHVADAWLQDFPVLTRLVYLSLVQSRRCLWICIGHVLLCRC